MKKVKKQMLNVVLFTLLFVIIACVTIGTYAWFTDQKSFSTNELKFGTITLNVTGDSISGENLNVVVTRSEQVVETTKLMPGDTVSLKFNVTLNTGCEPAYYLVSLTGAENLFDESCFYYDSTTKTVVSPTTESPTVGSLTAGTTHTFNLTKQISTDYETQGESVSITLEVYAIQQANLTQAQAYEQIMNMYVKNSTATYVRVGNYIYFGSFPQTYAGTSASALGITDTTQDAYGYYTASDGTKYGKLVVSDSSWRKLFDNKYSNGAEIVAGGEAYFKVEKVKWRILEESNGKALIVSDVVLGAIQFGATNNYKNSYLRQLLTQVYNVFTASEKQIIQLTTVDNSASTTYNTSATNVCENTQDYLFALSYSELRNTNYGFVADDGACEARCFGISDYALGMGGFISRGAFFWTRSPVSEITGTYNYEEGKAVSYVNGGNYEEEGCGSLEYYDNSDTTNVTDKLGVLPAMYINL